MKTVLARLGPRRQSAKYIKTTVRSHAPFTCRKGGTLRVAARTMPEGSGPALSDAVSSSETARSPSPEIWSRFEVTRWSQLSPRCLLPFRRVSTQTVPSGRGVGARRRARRREMRARYGVAGVLTVVAALVLGLAACGGTGPGSASVASVSTTTSTTHSGGTGTTVPKANAAGSLVAWASCMRSHGDPDQPDPTIDTHGGINIFIPASAQSLSDAVHNGTAPCNQYLAAASAALRAGARDLAPPDQAALLKFSQCMRANGVPTYPDPGTGGTSNFNGTGIDPNSPLFQRANNLCGKEIHAPSWWVTGAGPPGNVSVQSGPMCGASPCPPPSGAGRRGLTTGP